MGYYSHIVTTSSPMRLDRYLTFLYPKLTHGILEKLLRCKYILINNNKTFAGFRVSNDDIITCYKDLCQYKNYSKCNINLDIVEKLASKIFNEYLIYEDENFIAVNKPAKLATQGGTKITTSIDHAISYLNKINNYNLKLVHRLDKDTSGILLIAKNHNAAIKLTYGFREHEIQKTYIAIVIGKPEFDNGILSSNIAKSSKILLHAKTYYKVITTTSKLSLIEFKLITGRKHQIRIHACKELLCPIVGDTKYCNCTYFKSKYMLLHCNNVMVNVFDKSIKLNAPTPKYFDDFVSHCITTT